MAKCNTCGTTILMGGKKEGSLRFCNDKCYGKGEVVRRASEILPDVLEREVARVHTGNCPKCGKNGPVDIHTSHSIWSALYLSSWKSKPELCCRSCGRNSQIKGTLFSLFLGWWGLPWGLLITPLQIGRNIFGMLRPPAADKPSDKLRDVVRLNLASQIIAEENPQAPPPPIADPFNNRPLPATPPIALPRAEAPKAEAPKSATPKSETAGPFTNQDAFKS